MSETPICPNATVENLPVIGPTCPYCGLAPEDHGKGLPDATPDTPVGAPEPPTVPAPADIEELIRQLSKAAYNAGRYRSYQTEDTDVDKAENALLAAVREEAIREACRAVCLDCRTEGHSLVAGWHYGKQSLADKRMGGWPCPAEPIRALNALALDPTETP